MMRAGYYLFLVLMCVGLACGAGSGANPYWVDDNGAASWASAQSATPLSGAACCSLMTANANVVAGDTVNMRAGTYNAPIFPGFYQTEGYHTGHYGTSINNRVTYQAYNGESVIISNSAYTYGTYYLHLSLAGNWTKIDGIYFDLPTTLGIKGYLLSINKAQCNEISNCVFDGNNAHVVGMGWYTNSAPYIYNKYNWFHNNTVKATGKMREGGETGGMQIGAPTTDKSSGNNTIENNTYYDNGHHNLEVDSPYNILRHNRMHHEGSMPVPNTTEGSCSFGFTDGSRIVTMTKYAVHDFVWSNAYYVRKHTLSEGDLDQYWKINSTEWRLYDGLSDATLTPNADGNSPVTPFTCRAYVKSYTGHTDVTGSITIAGETKTCSYTGQAVTFTTSLTEMPTMTTSSLNCHVLIEAMWDQTDDTNRRIVLDDAYQGVTETVNSVNFYAYGADPTTGLYGNRNLVIYHTDASTEQFNLVESNRLGPSGNPSTDDGSEILALASSKNIVRENDLFGACNYALYFKSGWTNNGNHNYVYSNTLYNSGRYRPNPYITWYGSQIRLQAGDYNVIRNNLLNTYGGSSEVTNATSPPAHTVLSANWRQTNGDPKFIDTTSTDPFSTTLPDLRLQSTSGAIDFASNLTYAVGSGSGSTSLIVADSMFFQDGTWGSNLSYRVADQIAVGTVGNIVRISSINRDTNTITLASPISWSNNDRIWLYSNSDGEIVLIGNAPDAGAHEYYEAPEPEPTPSPVYHTVIRKSAPPRQTL